MSISEVGKYTSKLSDTSVIEFSTFASTNSIFSTFPSFSINGCATSLSILTSNLIYAFAILELPISITTFARLSAVIASSIIANISSTSWFFAIFFGKLVIIKESPSSSVVPDNLWYKLSAINGINGDTILRVSLNIEPSSKIDSFEPFEYSIPQSQNSFQTNL